MDDYMREMMDLKTLVTRSLEKKGVLAKIRADLRASIFEAIEDEDHALENEEGVVPALLGSCNDKAKQLHASPSGKLLTALVCEYLEWAQLGRTLKVYLAECNLPKGFWKSELSEKFGSKVDAEASNDGDNGPLLMEVLEAYLNRENEQGVEAGTLRGAAGVRGPLPENEQGVEVGTLRGAAVVRGPLPEGLNNEEMSQVENMTLSAINFGTKDFAYQKKCSSSAKKQKMARMSFVDLMNAPKETEALEREEMHGTLGETSLASAHPTTPSSPVMVPSTSTFHFVRSPEALSVRDRLHEWSLTELESTSKQLIFDDPPKE